MRMPGFTAEFSLDRAREPYRTAGIMDSSTNAGQVLLQQYPVDMEECWRRCIWTPWDCPNECQYVPWPTIPPDPKMLRRF